jgi:hypothetical protein
MLLSTELDGVINKEIISREKMKKELNKKKKIKSE